MATKILLNTTRIGSTVHNAGSAFDTVTEATTIARLGSAGGRLVDPTPAVVAAAALAVERRRKGEDVSSIDAMMAAAEGGGEGGGGGSINWRPDGTGDATTWAEVMAFLAGAGYGEAIVLASQFGGAYSIPPNVTPYDVKGAVFKAPLGNAAGTIIDVADGAVLHDCQGVTGGTVLAFHCTAAPAMTFTDPGGGSPASFFVEEGAGIVNLGTAPVMAIPAGVPMVVAALRSGSVGEIGGPPQGPIVFAGVGSFVICASMLGSTWIDGWLVNDGVDPTANCVFQQDGSLRAPNPVNAGFAGSTFNVAFGNYGGSGPTAFRPSAVFGPLSVGVLYYDTDLGSLIVWNGAAWVAVGGGAPPVGTPNTLAYFDGAGALGSDPALFAGGLDPYGRPQLRDVRQGTLPAANAVWRQGAWQVDGDATNVEGDGIVVYGKDPVSGLHDGTNGAFARIKCDRYGIRLITGGVDVGYGWRVDLTEFYFKDNTGAKTCNIDRTSGKAWFKELACTADVTLNRLPAPNPGTMFFDTTIGKPVWWTGAGWVDAAGAPA